MTTHVVADDVLGRVSRKQWELSRRILEGTINPGYAAKALQEIIEGTAEGGPFNRRYRMSLSPLELQLKRLRRYNSEYWDNYLTDEQLAAVDTSSEHAQSIDDLEILHIQFNSLMETVEMWRKVFMGEGPDHPHWDDQNVKDGFLKLLKNNVRSYEPGMHRIRLNLIAHWEPERGRTLEEVRKQAEKGGEVLAQLEVMSAYGVHPGLFMLQDGKSLPYADMAGTDVLLTSDIEDCALGIHWNFLDAGAQLSVSWHDFLSTDWAAPVLVES